MEKGKFNLVNSLTTAGYTLCVFMIMLFVLACIDERLVPYGMIVFTSVSVAIVLIVRWFVVMAKALKSLRKNVESDEFELVLGDKTDEKEIHFYKDWSFDEDVDIIVTHEDTKQAVNNNAKIIHTTALTMLSFDLLDSNYRIYLHENNKVLECKPGMEGTEKDIRKAHNILRIVVADVFDNYFYGENKTEQVNDNNIECTESKQEDGETDNDDNK